MKYFVSYSFQDGDDSGFGCAQVDLDKLVTSFDDVRVLIAKVKEINGAATDVTILYWKRFEDV